MFNCHIYYSVRLKKMYTSSSEYRHCNFAYMYQYYLYCMHLKYVLGYILCTSSKESTSFSKLMRVLKISYSSARLKKNISNTYVPVCGLISTHSTQHPPPPWFFKKTHLKPKQAWSAFGWLSPICYNIN